MRNSGDLVMKTLITTTYTYSRRGTGVSRSRTFFGFIGIRNLDEVDALCADTLGHYFRELVRPKAYWDFVDVMCYVGWGVVPLVLLGFCLFGVFSGALSDKDKPDRGDGKGQQSVNYRELPWQVQPDPGPRPPEVAKAKEPIRVGNNKVFHPHHPAPYAAVGLGKNKNGQESFQLYDLAKWEKHGKPIVTELEDGKRLAVSPEGKLVASRHRGKPTTMQYRGPTMPKVMNFEVKGEQGWVIDQVEFANDNRIFIGQKLGEGASMDSEMRFLCYEINPRKDVTGMAPRQFHPRHATFSPGGNYLAMAIPDRSAGDRRHLLAFWDLHTGKPAGSIEVATAGEPLAVAISPDGSAAALLLRTNPHPREWARLLCWSLSDRRLMHDHPLESNRLRGLDTQLVEGGKQALAWLPDGKGWLVLSYAVIDRDSGAIAGEITPRMPLVTTAQRVFRGAEATDLKYELNPADRTLGVIDLPKR